MKSIVQKRGYVNFPEFMAERVYMREFRKADGLPADLRRWQPTIDAMLEGVQTIGPIYLMIDQSAVYKGTTQRRPGVHIDGYWHPSLNDHGGRPPGHIHTAGRWDNGRWNTNTSIEWSAEGIILASDVSACAAYDGMWEGLPGEGGDCSHIDISNMERICFAAGSVYAGNVTMLHESLPVERDCLRTVVRLNVPGWNP